MDCRDVERLSQLVEFERRMLEARIDLEGMVAENKQREVEGKSMAYKHKDFLDLINRHNIGFNDYPYYCG